MAHTQKHLGPAKSEVAGFSQTSLMFSYFSQKVLIPPRAVAKNAVAAGSPALMGGLSPALYRLIVPARHGETSQILVLTKCQHPPRFHWFLPNFSSQYLCSQASYQKLVKAKSDHHHCQKLVFLFMTSTQRPTQRSSAWVPTLLQGLMWFSTTQTGCRGLISYIEQKKFLACGTEFFVEISAPPEYSSGVTENYLSTGWARTSDLQIMNQVFYNCATATL